MKSRPLEYSQTYKGVLIKACLGNIVQQDCDAIVNAANGNLAHGAGVAGAIASSGGSQLMRESREYVKKHGKVKTGQVAVTGPGKIKCKWVIHAVGPIWKGGAKDEPRKLKNACYNSLLEAKKLELTSIAIPAVSSGIFGFPKDFCAEIMVQAAKEFIDEDSGTLKEIRFANFDVPTTKIFILALKDLFEREVEESKEQSEESKEQGEESKEPSEESKEQSEESKETNEESKEQSEESKEPSEESKESTQKKITDYFNK